VSAGADRVRFLPPVAAEILQGLCQHRLLSTRQVHALYMPDVSLRYTQRILTELHHAELTDRTHASHGAALWSPTTDGRAIARYTNPHQPSRRHHGALRPPAGLTRTHTLAVNETGIAFVNAARARHDECHALSWHHDVGHPIPARDGRKDHLLITAALLTYIEIHEGAAVPHQRFIELDDGTLAAERLAEKLAAYKLLHHDAPQTTGQRRTGWRSRYRTFPWVLVVLAAQHPDTTQPRIQTLTALWHTDLATQHLPTIPMHSVTLEQLTRHGPYAPIFTSANHPGQPQNWLGEPATNGVP
jgi:Replication-relaxation